MIRLDRADMADAAPTADLDNLAAEYRAGIMVTAIAAQFLIVEITSIAAWVDWLRDARLRAALRETTEGMSARLNAVLAVPSSCARH